MKEKKTLMEMTAQELREEVGRLNTTLERVHRKNRARKRALKDINRSVLINHKTIREVTDRNQFQHKMVTDFKARAELAEKVMAEREKFWQHEMAQLSAYAHGREIQAHNAGYPKPELKFERPGFFARLFGRTRASRS